jgi:Domain of unknown function (DUF6371)
MHPETLSKLVFDKKRYRIKFCPCGKKNKDGKFAPYVGYDNCGYCHSCGKTFLPKLSYFEKSNSPLNIERKIQAPGKQGKSQNGEEHDSTKSLVEYYSGSLNSSDLNSFNNYLLGLFSKDLASTLIDKYSIGTSAHWTGANIFWQIDSFGTIRSGKIMLYNEITGRRVKEPFSHINWIHKVYEIPNFELKQCLFGEHLIRHEDSKPIAIVESEKSAIIASVFLPNFIWLATGGLSNLNSERFTIFGKKNIYFFPDLNCLENWETKADEIQQIVPCNIKVSTFLEKNASKNEKEAGLDIADFLIRRDEKYGWALSEYDYPLFWNK